MTYYRVFLPDISTSHLFSYSYTHKRLLCRASLPDIRDSFDAACPFAQGILAARSAARIIISCKTQQI